MLGVFKDVFTLTDSGRWREEMMRTRAVSATEHGGNDFRRRVAHPPESGKTAWSIGVLMCFLEQTGNILIHNSETVVSNPFTRWSWQRKQSWAKDRQPPWRQVR